MQHARRHGYALGRDIDHHRCGQRRRPGEQAVLVAPYRGLETLANRAERVVGLELGPTGRQHGHPERVGPPAGGGDERRLPDPGLALDGQQPAGARTCQTQRLIDAGQLGLALKQHGNLGSKSRVGPVARRGVCTQDHATTTTTR